MCCAGFVSRFAGQYGSGVYTGCGAAINNVSSESATFHFIVGLAVSADGNQVFVADIGNNCTSSFFHHFNFFV